MNFNQSQPTARSGTPASGTVLTEGRKELSSVLHFWRRKQHAPLFWAWRIQQQRKRLAVIKTRTGRLRLEEYDICGVDKAGVEETLLKPENWEYLGTGRIFPE